MSSSVFSHNLLTQPVDTWVFNNPSLRGLTLTEADWETLKQVADFLEVRHDNKEPISSLP
jgi:hypothetical protein